MDLVDRSSPSKQEKLPAGPVGLLPEPLLAKIFAYLPLKDRYLLVLVSVKWAAASRVPWTDVTFLNLTSLPRAMADPILGLCPKLKAIEAKDHTIILEETANLSIHENVRALTLRNVNLAGKDLSPLIPSDATSMQEVFKRSSALITRYFQRFPKLTDLSMIDCKATHPPPQMAESGDAEVEDSVAGMFKTELPFEPPGKLAASLKRLVFVRLPGVGAYVYLTHILMENAECVYLDGLYYSAVIALPVLCELCLVDCSYGFSLLAKEVAGGKFPMLKVLAYASNRCIDRNSLAQLLTAKIDLRILIIVGKDDVLSLEHRQYDYALLHQIGNPNAVKYPIALPPRKLSDCAAAAQSHKAPPLQIFVGGDFTKHVHFTLPPSDVAKFWRIDCPMPEYLAKPEVAEIFKGVWTAKIIREGPKNGMLPWGHPNEMDLFFSTEPLLFS